MEDKELKQQIIKDAQPLLDKIEALKAEINQEAEEEQKKEQEKNEPSSGVKQWIADKKAGLFTGKPLVKGEKPEEFNETNGFAGITLPE